MQIPALASALSRSFTHSDSPLADPTSKLHFHDRRTLYEDKSSQQRATVTDPFDVVVCPDTPDQLCGTLFDDYVPTTSVVSYSDGIVSTDNKSSNACTLRFFDYRTLQLTKLVNIASAKQVVHLDIVSDLLLLLTSDSQLILYEPVSCTVLSTLQLSYHFTAFKQVTNLDDSRTGKKINIALYTCSSCCQLTQIDTSLRKLSQLSPLIYLPFWPTVFISIEHAFFYFFSSSGSYQILSVDSNTHDVTSFPSSRSPLLIDPNHGKLRDVHILGSPDSFIFLQDNGWSIYQYQQPGLIGEKLASKVSNSLNNLQLIISSPLSSPYEKIVLIESETYILMSDRNMTLISDNHIQFIESEKTLLDIFRDYTSSNLLGIFSDLSENKNLSTIDPKQLSWKEITSWIYPILKQDSKIFYKDNRFTIRNANNRTILQNIEGREIGTIFDLGLEQIQIIDLNPILGLGVSMNYFLLMDSRLNFQLLILDNTENFILKSVKIASLQRSSNRFSLVYYYEREKILEFTDESNESMTIGINNLALSVSNSSSKSSKLVVFDSDERRSFCNIDSAMPDSSRKVSIEEVTHYNDLFSDNSWIGIMDHDQLALHKIDEDHFMTSPELFIIYTIVMGSSDHTPLCKLSEKNINVLHFAERVARYCVTNDSRLIEASINILYGILTQEKQVVRPLFQQCSLKQEITLVDTILMILCISFDETLIENYNSNKLFENIISYALLLNERICEICLDVLGKLRLENFRITEEQHENSTFDLIEFFNEVFFVRSTLFSDRKKRNFKNFQKCNVFLDSLFENNVVEFTLIMLTIIESDTYNLENKKCVLDYIVYIFIEKNDCLQFSGQCNLVVFLMVNSLFAFISRAENLFSMPLKEDDAFWESMSLLFNVLSSNLSYLVTAEYHGDWKASVYDDSRSIKVFVMLDILGYIGIIYSKNEFGEWFMKPVKSSRLKILKLDTEAGNKDVKVKQISEQLMENEGNEKDTILRVRNPIFFCDSTRLALVNLNTLSIQLWNLESDTFRDNLSIEVLKDDSIPLKIPDFNMLIFQYIWKYSSLDSDKEGNHERFTRVVEQFHHEIVDNATPTTSPLTSPKRKTSQPPFLGYTYSDLATIYEPYGEHQFGFLLDSYLKVFPTLKASDIGLAAIDGNSTSAQLQLTLQGQAIFVFTSS